MWEGSPEARSYFNAYQRVLYAQRKEAGLCPHCGHHPPYAGMVSCLACRAKQRRYNRLHRMRQRELRRQGITEERCGCRRRSVIACLRCQAPMCDTCYDLGEGQCMACVEEQPTLHLVR